MAWTQLPEFTSEGLNPGSWFNTDTGARSAESPYANQGFTNPYQSQGSQSDLTGGEYGAPLYTPPTATSQFKPFLDFAVRPEVYQDQGFNPDQYLQGWNTGGDQTSQANAALKRMFDAMGPQAFHFGTGAGTGRNEPGEYGWAWSPENQYGTGSDVSAGGASLGARHDVRGGGYGDMSKFDKWMRTGTLTGLAAIAAGAAGGAGAATAETGAASTTAGTTTGAGYSMPAATTPSFAETFQIPAGEIFTEAGTGLGVEALAGPGAGSAGTYPLGLGEVTAAPGAVDLTQEVLGPRTSDGGTYPSEGSTPGRSREFGDKPGYQFPWESLIGSGMELYGQRKDRKSQEEMMRRALESDPWRAQQSRYFEPTYEAATKGIGDTAYGDSILREVMSREAARGFSQSPRMLQEMARALNLGTTDYLRAVGPLASGRGGQGDIYSEFARTLGGSKQKEMGSLGKLFRDIMRGQQPSSSDKAFSGEQSRRSLPQQFAQLFLT